MNFVPNGKRVLMRLKKDEQTSEGGFIYSSGGNKEIQEAEVLSYDGFSEHSYVGSTAFFSEGAIKIKVSGEDLLVIDTDKILGFLVK